MSRALGRGLAALIPDSTFDAGEPSRSALRHVPIDEIRANPEQPRDRFEPEALAALTESIRQHGVLSPLVVRREGGRYFLIAGERRLRASAAAGLTDVPVVVREAARPVDQLELALVENVQRRDLDAIETARAWQRLIEEFGWTQGQVAAMVNGHRSSVSNAIRLLKLPDAVQDAVRDGRITAGHARALVPVTDAAAAARLVGQVVADQWSVRRLETEVRELHTGDRERRASDRRRRARTVEYANRLLTKTLSTKVVVQPRKQGGGRIVIDYGDGEQLDALIARLQRG